MTPEATTLWILTLIFDTFGQLALKAAAVADGDTDGLDRWQHMAKQKWIWLGVAAYVVEFFVWLAFLSMVPLAQGVLVGSVNILTVQLGGRIFFKELLTPKRILASAMVAGGVALVGWAG